MNFECLVALIFVVVIMAAINLAGAYMIVQRLDSVWGPILRDIRDSMVTVNNTMVTIHRFLDMQERRGPAE